ncbi:MAG: hypothetical protein V4580_10555 [Bacteroidota bacterium]
MRFKHIFFVCITLLVFSCKKDPVSPDDVPQKVTANNFLSDSKYKKLILQIAYVPGHEPTTAAIDHIKIFLTQRLNKSLGIEVNYTAVGSLNKSTLTLTDVKDIELGNRNPVLTDNTISMYIFYADADYFENTGSSQILGLAYAPASMVVFEKTIMDYAGGIGQPSVTTLEASVSEHEIGHILGLVNNGTSMVAGHEGGPSGKHCSNSSCLMYYTAETSDFIANLVGNNIPTLDNNCINDLKANGGK